MKKVRSPLPPANLNIAKFDTDKLTARDSIERLKNHMTFIFAPSKELSDYTEHIKPGDEEFFENTKKEQLSAALAKNMQRPPISYRLDALSMLIVLLAPTVHHCDPPTEAHIYFWAMLEAFREYMKTKGPYFDSEVLQQLTMDMTFAFYRLLVEGMDIAAEDKANLLKKIDALSIIARNRLNEDYPKRTRRITQQRAAEIITEIFAVRDLKGISSRQIRRWESEKDPTRPEWYSPGLRDLDEEAFKDNVRLAALAKQNKRQIKHAVSYENWKEQDGAVCDDPTAGIDEKHRAELFRQFEVISTENLAIMLENYKTQASKKSLN